ncbi:hypothetical protein SAMN04487950_2345 [Halogranum rubrum]|uniref:Uncharacterized protein n=1 Tax=Halogranum rubrum TaxID=553466 RepID=A0A1I4ER86_9EURY|nr:hypothetical protein [Halogranum rubrum]SFL08228.1 hypothetical protein SAMN04487950_2345 [Halogranum rubrum]
MRDDRAVSVGLNYVLTLGISAILISGLLLGLSGLLESQQEQTIRTELEVIGEQFAGDLGAADRLVLASDGAPTVELQPSLPQTVTGLSYTLEVVVPPSDSPYLRLSTERPDVTVRVPFTLPTLPGSSPADRLADSVANGGDVVIRYTDGELMVENA